MNYNGFKQLDQKWLPNANSITSSSSQVAHYHSHFSCWKVYVKLLKKLEKSFILLQKLLYMVTCAKQMQCFLIMVGIGHLVVHNDYLLQIKIMPEIFGTVTGMQDVINCPVVSYDVWSTWSPKYLVGTTALEMRLSGRNLGQ